MKHIKHKNLLPTPENLGLGPNISQGPVVVIVNISFAITSHILYRPVYHFLLLWPYIGNLQFNKTLRSVTCINCIFCVTPVQFNHTTYSWEQIKFHLHDNTSLNVQLLQKKIFETF